LLRQIYEKYLPVVFWPLFLILITWGTWHIVTLPENLPSPDAKGAGNGSTEPLKVRSRHPRLSESSSDGSVRWVLWSETLVGTIGQGGELTEILVQFTLTDGSVLTIEADRGSYDETEKHLEVSGDVHGEYLSASMEFTCNSVDYFHRDRQLALTGDVNLHAKKEGIKLACPEVVADLTERFERVEFRGGVDIDLYKLR